MPAGLVVNELLTNSLKHAFVGREGGTIRLHSLVDGTGCHITISDNGIGLPDGVEWPKPGKLGAAIAQSLRQNAGATIVVKSSPGNGLETTLFLLAKLRRQTGKKLRDAPQFRSFRLGRYVPISCRLSGLAFDRSPADLMAKNDGVGWNAPVYVQEKRRRTCHSSM
jgi:hypothetical protein